jgi:hypothetical protein
MIRIRYRHRDGFAHRVFEAFDVLRLVSRRVGVCDVLGNHRLALRKPLVLAKCQVKELQGLHKRILDMALPCLHALACVGLNKRPADALLSGAK